MYTLMTKLRAEGKKLVILENGWAGGWSFVCVVNPKIRVPEGGAVWSLCGILLDGQVEPRRGRLIKKSATATAGPARADF